MWGVEVRIYDENIFKYAQLLYFHAADNVTHIWFGRNNS